MGTSSSSMSSGNSGNFGTRNAQYNNPDEAEQYSNSSNHPYHTMINENDAAAFMRNMRTQTIGDANRSYMDFYSRVSQTSMLRESWNEQTEPLTSRDESYLSTDDSGSTTSTIASLPASENFSSIQTQSTQSVNEDTEKLFLEGQETNSGCKSTSASFEPESLVGHEVSTIYTFRTCTDKNALNHYWF